LADDRMYGDAVDAEVDTAGVFGGARGSCAADKIRGAFCCACTKTMFIDFSIKIKRAAKILLDLPVGEEGSSSSGMV